MLSGGDYTSVSSTSQAPQPDAEASLALDLGPTIRQNLQSAKIAEKITGVKTLLAVMSKGENVSEFYPLVVQEITSEDETLRHLSYVYLVHYAEADPDSALMSVNTFQRSLSDPDPIVRALALKILSSIRSPEIIEIVLDAVNTCCSDISPYVRKAAALALVKLYETDPSCLDSLEPLISRLLADQSIITISGALYALQRIAPDNDKFVHPVFRTLCKALPRLDPWGQSTALHILRRYARRNFKAPSSSDEWGSDDDENEQEHNDPDLDLLIKSTQPLLSSITPCVTLAAAALFFYCAPPFKLQLIAKPLIRLIYGDASTAYAALMAISSFAADNAEPFVPHVRHFFIGYDDPMVLKKAKLQVLSQLARPSNSDILMRELAQHIHDPDREVASAAVRAIGRTASLAGDASASCINVIVKMLKSPSLSVVEQAVQMLCLLLRPLPKKDAEVEVDAFGVAGDVIDEEEVKSVLIKLLEVFSKIEDPETRAALISLVGDKAAIIPLQAHEVLRQIAVTFPQQSTAVKMQAINLAAKVMAVRKKEVGDLGRYIFTLGYYDSDIDLRDKSRLIHALMAAPSENQYIKELRKKAEQFLFPEKPPVVWDGDVVKASHFEVGTFSSMFGKLLDKSALVVEWADPSKLPPSTIRDDVGFVEQNESSDGAAENDEDDMESFFGPAKKRQADLVIESIEVSKTQKEEESAESETEQPVQIDDNFDDYFG